MCTHPKLIGGAPTSVLGFIRDKFGCVPSCASVDQVEDSVLMDTQQITADLCFESVRFLHVAGVAGAWAGPFAADLAGLADLREQLQSFFWNSAKLQHLPHGVV